MADARPETTVTEGFAASIPAVVRRKFGIAPGDRLVWELKGSRLSVSVKKRATRGFRDFKPFDFGEATDAAVDHDEVL